MLHFISEYPRDYANPALDSPPEIVPLEAAEISSLRYELEQSSSPEIKFIVIECGTDLFVIWFRRSMPHNETAQSALRMRQRSRLWAAGNLTYYRQTPAIQVGSHTCNESFGYNPTLQEKIKVTDYMKQPAEELLKMLGLSKD